MWLELHSHWFVFLCNYFLDFSAYSRLRSFPNATLCRNSYTTDEFFLSSVLYSVQSFMIPVKLYPNKYHLSF